MADLVRFDLAECPEGDVVALRDELSISDGLAQVMVRRGFAEPDRARAFLAADEEHDAGDFRGIAAAVETIVEAVRGRRRITIHGDYDVDGICSTAIMVRCLRALGADVDWYLPDRIADGYGLSVETVGRLATRGTQLLITVDCAITAVEAVTVARSLGLGVVVTDHHAPRADGLLPDAPIVHPSLCDYPCPDLCATAVAYRLSQALTRASGAPVGGLESDLDLVALATIADVVPLVGENRTLVRRGLRALAATTKPGLRALMAVARVDATRVDERAVGFGLAPRLNAAGRLYRADAGLELILTDDHLRAAQIADELDRANHERRRVELSIRIEAEAQIKSLSAVAATGGRGAYVLAGEGWHPGVVGIVASRLVEAHCRPVILIALDGESGRGSGRSIDGFDLLGGLRACEAHLVGYGGHRAAAGLQIGRDQVQAFADALDLHARGMLRTQDMTPRERVDAVVGGEQLGMELAEELRLLAPYGRGNPVVSLLVRGATLSDPRPMGENRHVRFTVSSEGAHARAVAFGGGGRLPVAADVPVDATFTLEVNEYRGVCEPRLVARRIQPAAEIAKPQLAETEIFQPQFPEPQVVEPQIAAPTGELVLF